MKQTQHEQHIRPMVTTPNPQSGPIAYAPFHELGLIFDIQKMTTLLETPAVNGICPVCGKLRLCISKYHMECENRCHPQEIMDHLRLPWDQLLVPHQLAVPNTTLGCLMSDEDILQKLPEPEWLVDGLLGVGEFACLYGAPENGKSFVALNLALHIAAGVPWAGKRVKRGVVVYLAERLLEHRERVWGWKLYHGCKGLELGCYLRPMVNAMNEADIAQFEREIAGMPREPVLVVIDTVSECLGGADENSPAGMGLLLQLVRRIQHITRAAVLPIHHNLQNTEKLRGHTSLLGSLSTAIFQTKRGNTCTLTCKKSNTGPRFEGFPVHLEQVPTADSRTTLVVKSEKHLKYLPVAYETSKQMEANSCSRLLETDKKALAVLPVDGPGMIWTDWQAQAELKKRTFNDVINRLQRAGRIIHKGKLYWRAE